MPETLTYTPEQAAKLMQVSLPTMYELCRKDSFPAIHIGRKILIPAETFKRWINEVSGVIN